MASMQQLRVIRPNPRRMTSSVVAQGTWEELLALGARGRLRTLDLVEGWRPGRSLVPVYELPEMARYVPDPRDAELRRMLEARQSPAGRIVFSLVSMIAITHGTAIVMSLRNGDTATWLLLGADLVVLAAWVIQGKLQRARL
jgi:hypothetical protein